jgi:hypothetical protein
MVAKPNLSQPQELRSLIQDEVQWGLLMNYVAVEKDRVVNQLLKCTESELRTLQGEHKALAKLESLSTNLKAEESNKGRYT